MSLKPYKTLLKRDEEEFIINKSVFIGHGKPCETEEEALDFIREMRETYKDATHNCYAYAIGTNMGIMRYSDDGEPGGTAGLPMMEVLKQRQVTNCCVGVTRYFGGILLGAGGLVRAYSQGAAAAVNACGVGVMHPTARYLLDVSYPMLNKIEYHLKSQPIIVEEKEFAESITFTLVVKTSDEEAFVKEIIRVTDARVEPVRMEEIYLAWPEEE